MQLKHRVALDGIELECRNLDIPFSDNWFPLHANEPVNIYIPKRPDLTLDLLREEIYVIENDL